MGARAESAQDHGGAATHRGDGKVDREPRSDENECGIALERTQVNDEARMTNDERSTNARMTNQRSERARRHSDFVIASSLDIRHSSLSSALVATDAQLAELLKKIDPAERVGIDTEADSLHCYREKLCLVQVGLRTGDHIVDPLADIDVAPLRLALERSEIVLHGADYDLRMLRRGLDFVARRIFDTLIAARLLGIREFSLAA